MQLWYDRHGSPIDAATADRLLRDKQYRRIALTEITSASDPDITWRVSTVWLGTNHDFDGGPPIIFETMVFADGSMDDKYMDRYAIEEQARAGHAEIVTMVAATVPDERIADLDEWPTG